MAQKQSATEFYSIKALHNLYIHFPVPGSLMYFQDKYDQTVQVFGYIWLIRGGGKTIVVDTGLGAPPTQGSKAERQVFGNFAIDPGKDTVSLLQKEGLAPEDVDYVILTHLHFDHCANIGLFKRAQIFISRRGWSSVVAPEHPRLVPEGLFPRSVYAFVLNEAWNRVMLLPAEAEILPGLQVFWVGGHTPCSQAIRVNTTRGKVILTGDTAFLYGNIEEDIPVGYCTNLAECFQAMDRFRREGDLILPSHDPLVLERFPGGVIA
jgi:glyoxylase-like metal-dependent hydrolase (beta-lactamase superfamily II)